ncbi:cytochrome c maturation protein CcmE domain-containing protein [Rhodocaloribacter sp.]|jgi:cytochrome c-type biogenesis protein CcmE
MKKKTIIGLLLLVGFTSVLFMNFGQQVGGYMNFVEAAEAGAKAHVVGAWVKDRPARYDPAQNLFSFYMRDELGNVRLVHYANPKPANFEDAERLVIDGYAQGDTFVAEHILVKCPSKYNDTRDLQKTSMP